MGVVAAAVLIGGFLLAYNAVLGDDSGPDFVEVRLTPTPTVALALGQSTPVPTRAAGSPAPSGSPTVTTTGTPSGSPTPTVTGTPQPNRADCNQIRGTDYLSDAERVYFNANCLIVATPVPTVPSTGSGSGGDGGQPQGPLQPPPPPVPTLPPRNPVQVAFEGLIGNTISEADAVLSRLAAPRAVDSVWRNEVSAHISEVQRLVGVASVTPPPQCLVVPYQTIRSAGIELSIGAGLASSGVDANDVNLMRLAQQRIGTGRSGLINALIVVNAASC